MLHGGFLIKTRQSLKTGQFKGWKIRRKQMNLPIAGGQCLIA